MQEDYVFTDLHGQEPLLQEIRKLEERIERETGETINLIAYSKKPSAHSDSSSQ